MGKAPRRERPVIRADSSEFSEELDVNDVCRNKSAWNQFIKTSSMWSRVGAALATKRRSTVEDGVVHGISLCPFDGTPHYIPLSEEYFPGSFERHPNENSYAAILGNGAEEALCPSSTPSQSISLEERISCVSSILQSCEVSFVDALRDCYLLWRSFKLMVSRPVSISYLAFLAHLRDGERPLQIRDIAAKFEWDLNVGKFLRMNPRINSAAQSYLASRLVERLSPLVVECSSKESLQLEIHSLQAVNNLCLGGFLFDSALSKSLVQKLKRRTEELEQECFELAGRNFNLDSPSQVAQVYLKNILKLKLLSAILGNGAEEALCPSSTPSQSISLEERISCVSSILQSCEISFVDALRDCYLLWRSFKLMVSRPVSISYLAFLAHLRDGERPLQIRDIAAKFEWDLNVGKFLRMNPRISSAAQSYLASRLVERLSPLVVECSSKESLQLEIHSLQAVNNLCLGGFLFDSALSKSLVQKLKRRTEELEQECFELAGRNFNMDSPSQVAQVLFSRLHLPHPGGSSSKSHMSTNKAILEQMKSQHPIVEKILEYRHLRHAITQCIVPLQRFVSDDGMVRTQCEMCTSTGRILCMEPNLQTVPKETVLDGITPRHLFKAQKGCVLLSADYSQLELRVLAHLSGDPSLIEHLSDGRDMFEELSKKWEVSRESVKRVCYGIIYEVRSYINDTREKGINEGFVTTFLGRRRVTSNAKGRQKDIARDDRQSINYTVQGTASEVFKKALVRLEETRKGSTRIVLPIHDEIIIECTAKDENKVAKWMRDCLENVFPEFKVPLPVKIRSGPNWGSLTLRK
ncbi:DNA-directed DNA polymerase [Oesophagostomum dentatum]|uniref:DNA-directed DNA polymerase n=1 Tax=Oesophagostomum dentatum TaxID=61180 RepID=A0A0B1TH56_OESDE|nr:DNA-directed DNA polymerase [Oesophagostomum dentatum]